VSTIHLTTGLPASGKTTYANKLVAESNGRVRRVNLDDIRMMMDLNDGSRRFPGANEDTVLKVQDAAILGAINDGFDIIVDNTHLVARLPNRYKRLVGGRATFHIHDFTHVPVDTCIDRDQARERSVGPAVIKDMHERMRRSKWRLASHPMNDMVAPEPYRRNDALPPAVICDIDGTLAIHNGRGPYDFEQVGTDLVNPEVRRILDLCRNSGGWGGIRDRIILLSGRQSEYRAHTERWLDDNGIVYDELWMRAEGDRRGDDIVKAELFDAHVRDLYDVRFVLDDRDRVVALWRRMGLECWQVNYGDF
jgi:predicted kinase